MDFSKIKDHRLAVLEQACERYAIMAFETLNGCLAIGLRSIKYSYENDKKNDRVGHFTATFIPWDSNSGAQQRKDRSVGVTWRIEALASGGWRLYDGLSTVQDAAIGGFEIFWNRTGQYMIFEKINGNEVYASKGYKSGPGAATEVTI